MMPLTAQDKEKILSFLPTSFLLLKAAHQAIRFPEFHYFFPGSANECDLV